MISIYAALCLLLIKTSSQNSPDNNDNIYTDVQLIQGDIILTKQQQKLLEPNSDDIQSPQNAVISFDDFKWPGGIIPYELDSSLYDTALTAIVDAMYDYQNYTCVRFKPRAPEDEDFVKFYNGYGCSSSIGRVKGQQEISIGQGCDKKGIVIHEIFHTLGRWHEQARPDRNEYIVIHPENIRPGFETNFEKISKAFATTQGIPYDYDSVMHYPINAFSYNGKPTILPTDKDIDIKRLGQRTGLSISDIAHVRGLYCGGDSGEWSGWSTWSSCSKTCNGGIRHRRRTCIGDSTCIGSNIHETVCNIEQCTTPPQWGQWSVWSGCTAICGGGRQRRIRTCLNGNICDGQSDENKDCNEHDCPNTLSNWSSWSECDVSGSHGCRYRSRYCQNGKSNNCTGETRQQQNCTSEVQCGLWSDCSKSCGGGIQVNLVTQESIVCNDIPCHSEICLEGIKHIGCYKFSNLKDALNETSQYIPPPDRTEPIRKCAESAFTNNHSYIIIARGLCYSGTNELKQYFDIERAEGSGVCQNGSGVCQNGTDSSSLIAGDVYYIEDGEKFEISSVRAENCGFDYCMNPNVSCDDIYSGSNNITRTSTIVLLLLLLLSIM